MSLLGFARDTIAAPGLYGCYGGLHLSIFDTWKPEFDDIIDEVKALGMTKMGCNHCTGWMWAEKAATHGVPIVKGTDAYLGYPKRSRAGQGQPRLPRQRRQRQTDGEFGSRKTELTTRSRVLMRRPARR